MIGGVDDEEAVAASLRLRECFVFHGMFNGNGGTTWHNQAHMKLLGCY